MNTQNIKMRDAIAISRKIGEMTPEEVFCNEDFLLELNDRIVEYMNRVSEEGKRIILERIDEEEFVEAVAALTATLTHGMLVQEGDVSLLRFMMNGNMQAFIHTIVISVIGMLVEEEVL